MFETSLSQVDEYEGNQHCSCFNDGRHSLSKREIRAKTEGEIANCKIALIPKVMLHNKVSTEQSSHKHFYSPVRIWLRGQCSCQLTYRFLLLFSSFFTLAPSVPTGGQFTWQTKSTITRLLFGMQLILYHSSSQIAPSWAEIVSVNRVQTGETLGCFVLFKVRQTAVRAGPLPRVMRLMTTYPSKLDASRRKRQSIT